ncbi:MAG: hypothetical protein ACTTKH_05755 [Treponema sp.]
MSSITNEMIYYSYKYAKDVFLRKIKINDAVNILATEYFMNKALARDCINNYKCMRKDGKQYKRTMDRYATKYF